MSSIRVERYGSQYIARCRYEDKDIVKAAGFRWDGAMRQWYTTDAAVAAKLDDVEGLRQRIASANTAKVEAIQASRASDSDADIPRPEGLEYLPYQRAGIAYARRFQTVLIGDDPGLGKAQPLDSTILTPAGPVLMRDVIVGTPTFGANGLVYEVTGVYPQGWKDIYRVRFSDGSSVECCGEHLWLVTTANDRKRGDSRVLSLDAISSNLAAHYAIPMVQPLQFTESNVPLDPYLMGALLGNGKLATGTICISTPDQELLAMIEPLLPPGIRPVKTDNNPSRCDYHLVRPAYESTNANELKTIISKLGLRHRSEGKFIPDCYKYGSVEQRKSLLSGLLDTDGTTADGTTEYATASDRLCDDVQFVVESLGGKAVKSSRIPWFTYKGERRDGQRSYRLNIALPAGWNPFRLTRKALRFVERTKYQPKRVIVAVDLAGRKECQCIAVSAPDHLYVTDRCIVTHNTIQAAGIINDDDTIKRVVVICPASLRINWKRELTKWLVRKFTIGVVNDGKTWPSMADIVICNYDVAAKHKAALQAGSWDLLISDESHLMKSPDAARTVAILGRKQSKKHEAVAPIPARRKVFLTGTPIPNRPVEGWWAVEQLGVMNSFFAFATKYCAAKKNCFGWDFTGSSNLAELQEKLRAGGMIRRLKADVLKELPPKRRCVIELPANGTAKVVKAEADAWADHEATIDALRVAVELAKASESPEDYREAVLRLNKATQVAFTDMSKRRHDTAVAKVPYVVEHLRGIIEQDRKVICFVHHKDVADAIMGEFPEAVKVTGEVSMPDRQAAVDRFQTDPNCLLFVGNIQAAGVGLTLTASSHVVFAELDWVPGNVTQAEDRCHRIGQNDSVLIEHLVLEGSMDARMATALIAKQSVITAALDELPEQPMPTPTRERGCTEEVSRKQIVKEAAELGPEAIAEIHRKLQMLAGVCDGARELDGAGFNRFDSAIGKSLAMAHSLTQKQAALGARLVAKYRRQLG